MDSISEVSLAHCYRMSVSIFAPMLCTHVIIAQYLLHFPYIYIEGNRLNDP